MAGSVSFFRCNEEKRKTSQRNAPRRAFCSSGGSRVRGRHSSARQPTTGPQARITEPGHKAHTLRIIESIVFLDWGLNLLSRATLEAKSHWHGRTSRVCTKMSWPLQHPPFTSQSPFRTPATGRFLSSLFCRPLFGVPGNQLSRTAILASPGEQVNVLWNPHAIPGSR